jgi:alkanesulfonate monooxygenase SsuD/methylene tetrahydromethanopterin reductase-like flavin-dependent oxidoreductase (luciferase family)
MAKALMLAWSSPVSADRAAEFHDWYERTHIPQVRAAVPAITAVSRYELADPDAPEPTLRFLAVYELDDADIGAAAAAVAASAAAGKLAASPAMDLAGRPPMAHWYRALPG